MNHRPLLLLIAFVILHSSFVIAAPPPELTVLRQQYDKIVTERVNAPFEAAKAALDTKFSAALDNAIAAAKQAGKLDDVLAIQGDQKRLAEKLPLPDDTDTTPESLKNLRGIYREQLKNLDEARTTNLAAILPAYNAKLTDLEAVLVKNDRIDEAKELRAYREGLVATAPAVPAPAMASAPTKAAGETVPPEVPPQAPIVKGDDRKAAEWLLGQGGMVQLLGGSERFTKVGDLPKGKFVITNLWYPSGAPKVEDAAFDVLSGLQGLLYVSMRTSEQSDESLRFLSTCPNIQVVDFQSCSGLSGAWLHYLAPLKGLKRIYCISSAKMDVSGLAVIPKNALLSITLRDSATSDADLPVIAQFKQLEFLGLRKTRVTDAGIAQLADMPNLVALDVSENPISAEALKPLAKLRLEELGFGLNAAAVSDAAELLGMVFPRLSKFTFGPGSVSQSHLTAVAKTWPKLTRLDFPTFTQFDADAFSGISSSLATLEEVFLYQTKLADVHLADLALCKKLRVLNLELCPAITDAALTHLAAMKALKTLHVAQTKLTPAALATFKKQRPDVTVK